MSSATDSKSHIARKKTNTHKILVRLPFLFIIIIILARLPVLEQRQTKTNKHKQRQTKANKDKQRQTKTNNYKQRQKKTNKDKHFHQFGQATSSRTARRGASRSRRWPAIGPTPSTGSDRFHAQEIFELLYFQKRRIATSFKSTFCFRPTTRTFS